MVRHKPLLEVVAVGHIGFDTEQCISVRILENNLTENVSEAAADLWNFDTADKSSTKIFIRKAVFKNNNRMILRQKQNSRKENKYKCCRIPAHKKPNGTGRKQSKQHIFYLPRFWVFMTKNGFSISTVPS